MYTGAPVLCLNAEIHDAHTSDTHLYRTRWNNLIEM